MLSRLREFMRYMEREIATIRTSLVNDGSSDSLLSPVLCRSSRASDAGSHMASVAPPVSRTTKKSSKVKPRKPDLNGHRVPAAKHWAENHELDHQVGAETR